MNSGQEVYANAHYNLALGLGKIPGYPPGDVLIRVRIHLSGYPSIQYKQIRALHFDTIFRPNNHDALHDGIEYNKFV